MFKHGGESNLKNNQKNYKTKIEDTNLKQIKAIALAVISCETLTSSLECVPVRGPSSRGSVLRRGSAAPSSLTPGTLDSHSFLTPSVHLQQRNASMNSIHPSSGIHTDRIY